MLRLQTVGKLPTPQAIWEKMMELDGLGVAISQLHTVALYEMEKVLRETMNASLGGFQCVLMGLVTHPK